MKLFDSLLNNTYEFPDTARPEEIKAAVEPLHRQFFAQQQQPSPLAGMNAGALNQIGSILQMSSPVPRFPKVDRATAAALGNNFQPYMQARRQDIQAQQQDRRAAKENALREKAMFMQQQRKEQERRDRLAYQQMLMDNNEREEQLALKRFELEAARAAREEQRYKEEQARAALPQWKVDPSMGMAYALDPATGQVMVKPIPEMQAAMARRAAGSGGGGAGGAGGGENGLSYSALQFAIRYGVRPDTVAAYENGTATPDQQAEIASATYRMQVAEVQEKRQAAKDSVLRAGGSAEEAEAAAGQYQLPPEPPEVASRRRAEDLARNAGVTAASKGSSPEEASLAVEAVRSLVYATPDEAQRLVDAGLVSVQNATAALLARGLTLPGATANVPEPFFPVKTMIEGAPRAGLRWGK